MIIIIIIEVHALSDTAAALQTLLGPRQKLGFRLLHQVDRSNKCSSNKTSPPANSRGAPRWCRRPLPQDCRLWIWLEFEIKESSARAPVQSALVWRLRRTLLLSCSRAEGSRGATDQPRLHRLPEDEEGQGSGGELCELKVFTESKNG